MKKTLLAVVAAVLGLALSACQSSPTEKIMKSVNEFFTQAEQKIQTVGSAEELMARFKQFNAEKDEFLSTALADYVDKDGNFKNITEEIYNDLQNQIYERATAYNKVEGEKCSEYLTPIMDRYENAVNALYEFAESEGKVSDEQLAPLIDELNQAREGVMIFAEYDNIPKELQDRFKNINTRLEEF